MLKTTDSWDILPYTIKSASGTPVDLTNATVSFIMAKTGSLSPVINKEAEIIDAESGKVQYKFTETDTLLTGTFNAEFQVVFPNEERKTFPTAGYLKVQIASNLDGSQAGSIEEQIVIQVSEIEQFKEDIDARATAVEQAIIGVDLATDNANTAADRANSAADNAEGMITDLQGVDAVQFHERQNTFDVQLAETMSQKVGGGIKAELEDLSANVLGAIEGGEGTSFNLLSIPQDNSVTLEKIAIKNKSTNLYDESESVFTYYVNTYEEGELVYSKNSISSGFIPIEPNAQYFIKKVNHISYFDETKTFLSGTNSAPGDNAVITTPSGSKFMRFSWITPTGEPHISQKVNKGNQELSYEPFYQHIQPEYIKIDKVGIEDIAFSRPVKNLFNKNDVHDNLVLISTGELTFNDLYRTSKFISLPNSNQFSFTSISSVAWYDENLALVEYGSAQTTMTKPSNTKYMRVSVLNSNLDLAQVETGSSRTSYEPFELVVDEKYLPKTEGESSTSSNSDDYESRKAIIEKNAMEYVPNNKDALNIPSYVPQEVSGREHITHPNVLYFEEGWNGYKYWMTMTPYPYSDNQYENPSIVASNDNITWEEPAPNPVAPLEETETFQSDPEILMNGDTMELWYRATLNTDGVLDTTFYRKTSTDGVNWTDREAMFTNLNTTDGEIVSPAILFEDGLYKMWFTRRGVDDVYTMEYGESEDGKEWDMRVLDIDFDYRDYYFWHGDVYKHEDGKIDMVIGCKSNDHEWALFYTYSYDNINFVPPMLLIKPTSGTTRWDNYNLYKASLEKVGNEYYLYYATPRHVGLTKGKTMLDLGSHDKPETEEFFPVKHLRSSMNAYEPTDTFEAFPGDAIVHTKVWSSEDNGWPSLAGLLITQNIWKEYNDTRQFFYPKGEDYFLIRTSISSGWTPWKTIEETV
ncbi:BppU family phage baseplate upper protein [Sutcliffiella horikoshii]|uniref:BppU family phage baseplate upper protein n=1 Tax=Sutcliffiella horikoshii TaxID=79883 RepID=UPI001653AC20|nr:BppU family phage baseplate upper protein [Sutcliffiella horikoshii]